MSIPFLHARNDPETPSVALGVVSFEAAGKRYEAVARGQWQALRHTLANRRRAGSLCIGGVAHVLLERIEAPVPPKRSLAQILTGRELQIARLIADGFCDKAVARELGISDNTVREHLRRVFHKTQITKRTSLVALVMRNGEHG
jgi:DNA-binding NarL/FixJ family response regulator